MSGPSRETNLRQFTDLLKALLGRFEGFDASAISDHEFGILFSAYEDGATLEDIGTAIVDGSAYDKYFGEDDQHRRKQ